MNDDLIKLRNLRSKIEKMEDAEEEVERKKRAMESVKEQVNVVSLKPPQSPRLGQGLDDYVDKLSKKKQKEKKKKLSIYTLSQIILLIVFSIIYVFLILEAPKATTESASFMIVYSYVGLAILDIFILIKLYLTHRAVKDSRNQIIDISEMDEL